MTAMIASADWNIISVTGTFLIAVWGAGLSTYVWYEQRRWRLPQVRVDLSHGMFTCNDGHLGDWMIFLKAANFGDKSVLLYVPIIRLQDRKSLVMMDVGADVRFPHELVPGHSCQAWIDRKLLFSRLRQEGYCGRIVIHAEYRDAADRVYKSKPWKVHLDAGHE